MNPVLDIVTWDVPWPADYGGAIDVYHRCRCLKEAGVKIHLHCFEYGERLKQDHLLEICEKVSYYPRRSGLGGFDFQEPYIVHSRRNATLLKNLQTGSGPVLFEGLHTTAYLDHPALQHRARWVRTHNIEHDYYLQLAGHTTSFVRRLYLYRESILLRQYEKKLDHANHLFCISEKDTRYFSENYKAVVSTWLPAFHPEDRVNIQPGRGNFCLYHGNLSIAENEKAAMYLATEIFNHLDIPFIIAGKNPGKILQSLESEKIQIIANPDHDRLQRLIEQAHIHVLPAFQDTGIKLKLLHALFCGRHCLVNSMMLNGTHLQDVVHVAEDAASMTEKINQLWRQEFNSADIAIREQNLHLYKNNKNVEILLNTLQRHYQ